MKRYLTLLVTVLALASLTGCAEHKVAEQKVEKEMKEVSIPAKETIAESAHDLIMKSDKLTDVQKKKLLELQEKTHTQSVSLTEQIEKAKMVLIQTVLEPKMNEHEYAILKKKISKLEKERMENGFKAMKEARNIIDPKKNVEGSQFYKAYLHSHLQEF